MGQRPIEEWWHELDPGTRQWFREHPGVQLLPRTVTNVVHQLSGSGDRDQHGELELSVQDRDFIKARALEQDRA
jgi:hypothetical protein